MRELIVDSFAGGGGASLGIEMATGRSPDYAINHDAEALAMHAVNHPATVHLELNIWQIDPGSVDPGRPVGLLWASPDCKHHSKAKGGKPLSRNIRDLAWVVVLWAQRRRPRVICLEGAPRHGLVAASLAQHNTDMVGHGVKEPVSTIVQKGCTQAVVSAGLVSMKGSDQRSRRVDDPHPTITAQGTHSAEVRAFLIKYYGSDAQAQAPADPLHTVPTKPRFGLVMVQGEPYEIVDIGMRMLRPRELFRAQGFPDSYVIDRKPDGSPLTATASVRMCGNSVSPVMARALVAANYLPGEGAKPDGEREQALLFREAAE